MGELGFTRSAKKELSSIDCDALFGRLGHLGGVYNDFLLLYVHSLEGKEVGGVFVWLKYSPPIILSIQIY